VKRKESPTRPPGLAASDIRSQVSAYIDRFGWDIAENEIAWRMYQRRQMQREYGRDQW